MTHATPEEIHDHAYGFCLSEHIAACASCQRRADAVADERQTLKDALRETPMEAPADLLGQIEHARARRRRLGAPALAAAALLLGALAWMLFQPRSPVVPPETPSATSTHEEDLEQILEQLKSSSPLRQELARMALKKYGGLAIPALERAKADPTLIEECRGFNLQDQEMLRKAQTTRLTVAWEGKPLVDAIDQVRTASGFNFVISQVPNPYEMRVTLSLKNASVVEILDGLKSVTQLPWGRILGRDQQKSIPVDPSTYAPIFLFGRESDPAPSSAPVRIRSLRGWAAEQLRVPPDRRTAEEEARLILRLAHAADPSLWEYLDSPRAELRRRAEEGLRRLYGPPPVVPPLPMERNLAKQISSLSYENQPSGDILLDLGFQEGVALVLDPRLEIPEVPTTFQTKDLSVNNNLKLFLTQQSLSAAIFGGALLITKPEWRPFRLPEMGPLWTTPDDARRAESVIDDLASGDAVLQERARTVAREAGRDGLRWICHGRSGIDPSRISRFSDALDAQASQMGVMFAEAAGAAYQQDLSPTQRALLSKPLSLKSRDQTLEALLKSKEIKLRLQAPMASPVLVSSPSIRVDTLMVALTRPLGLDFMVDGDTIVVDTVEKVRKAVENK
jgi:hypothetical protein